MSGKQPVLILAYNRPRATEELLGAIRTYSPARLYVACDGPRLGDSEDGKKVQTVRHLTANPGWECTVTTLFRPENLGLRVAVTDALDWFFENEDEGIILEDDCVPTPDFFRLAEHCLDTYRDSPTVWGMTGSNTAGVTMSHEASYGFTQHSLIWGWASWADRWRKRDYGLSTYPLPIQSGLTRNWPSRNHKHVFFRHLTAMAQFGLPNTWDYPWTWTVMRHRGLWIVPNAQLVTNIGYGEDATNTKGAGPRGPLPTSLGEIIPPSTLEPNYFAEDQILSRVHGLRKPSWLSSVRFSLRFLFALLSNKTASPPVLPGTDRESV